MAKQKEGFISFGESTIAATPRDLPIKPVDLEFLTQRVETLTSLLTQLLHVTGQINGNGVHAKNRCYNCANGYNHEVSLLTCPCVCHEARRYLTQLAME